MKTFENPEILVKSFAAEDIITTSGGWNKNSNATPWG